MLDESGKRFPSKQLYTGVKVETSLQGLSESRRQALGWQVEAIDLADRLQAIQLGGFLEPSIETRRKEQIANCLEKAAHHLDRDPSAYWDAQLCRANAKALRCNGWKNLTKLYLEHFAEIRQPIVIAPVPEMHNHPSLYAGFVGVVSDEAMASGLAINDPSQLARLSATLYPDCQIGMVKTRFVGAHVVKATKIHHPPFFMPEYLPNPPAICNESVGYLLNTYTAQSIHHTLAALEPFWLPSQLAQIRQLFELADGNKVQAVLISLHNMTHFLGSKPLPRKDLEPDSLMRGVDEELRADSGSNIGLHTLGKEFFDPQLIEAVILMDILDRAFKYTLVAQNQKLDELIFSHHDAAAGQMRLNALRFHGALKQVRVGDKDFYYLDYEACIQSDRIIIAELEALDRLSLQDPEAYQQERLKFCEKYLGTNEAEGWKLDPLYYEVRSANYWLEAQLVFEYPVELELFADWDAA
jgi:hypothetical protein